MSLSCEKKKQGQGSSSKAFIKDHNVGSGSVLHVGYHIVACQGGGVSSKLTTQGSRPDRPTL